MVRFVCAGLVVFFGFVTGAFADPATWARPESVVITDSKGGEHFFNAELAVAPDELTRGLMGRTDLADDAGMLFVFENARERSFWMRDTLIFLDILFIDEEGRIIKIQENAKPKDETQIPSGGPVLGVLEIKGGRAAALGIQVGDTVHHNLFGNVLDAQANNP
ncbi:MAG: DUF192 domain-containing protein [Rhodospirillales bacterium]|nr:DUF192 domain-containing protein [Rhodospirillales bacterium]